MRYISIFSGIEAASCAWQVLGFEPVAFAEIDKYASAVLAAHYPTVPNLGDVSSIDWSNYRGNVDIVVGGSPCQSFSIAGNREGLNGASGLMWEYVRCIREVKPAWLVWENVPGALSSSQGEDFRCLLVALAELGYGLSWRVLDAQYFGVPQARRRVYVVGHLGDDSSVAVLFDRESLSRDTQTLRKSRATSPITNEGSLREASTYTLHIHHGRSDNGGGRGAMIKTDISPTICASARPTIFCRGNHHSKAACYEELAPTLTAHAKAEAPLISLTPPRHLTPRECERLQGFPDDWTAVSMPNGKPVSNTQRYKMLGNSMAVPVMRWIGARILLVERSNNAN